MPVTANGDLRHLKVLPTIWSITTISFAPRFVAVTVAQHHLANGADKEWLLGILTALIDALLVDS
jgi:hypothetical protein